MPQPKNASASATSSAITLETANDLLQFDPATGRLISFRSKAAPDQEFALSGTPGDPVFVIQYLTQDHRFRQLASHQATSIAANQAAQNGTTIVTFDFRNIGGFDLDARVTVTASPADRFSRWSIALRNNAGLAVTDVQFPFVVMPYRLAGTPGSEAVMWPFNAGVLQRAPQPQDLPPDYPNAWQFRPENGDASHYPGLTFAQFMAYYNDRAGLYMACEDATGKVKLIKPVHREPGLRLGISHVGDWPANGERKLEYDVVLGSFTGDWYAAAALYREWSLQQPWAAQPLHQRTDTPAWLLDSPPHIIVRIQGLLDFGPATPNEEFLPYSKCIPLLDALAKRIDAPLVPVIMSWERPGPWVYPDCFPPAGGNDSLREFTEMARQRGWHIGTFCNGTRWVTGHFWSGYQGDDYFEQQGGAQSICRTHDGGPWHENWDATWRPSYAGCLGTQMTRDIAANFVRTVLDLGLDWVQFFDQNVGACAFPCYATDHEHAAMPGRWMPDSMSGTMQTFRQIAAETHAADARRTIALSVECPANEYNLPQFDICDVRVVPPGHTPGNWIPLYHFLYHEFILIQGGFGSAPAPYHMPIRNAYNLVTGEIPGGVLIGNGNLLNWDTMNWAPWEPEIGNNDDSVAMLRASAALRRGPAKDFLTFGRMLAPAQVEGIPTVRWQEGGRDHQIPAVFHAVWQSPAGNVGFTLANWTTEPQTVEIRDPRLASRVTIHTSTQDITSEQRAVMGSLKLTLPPLGCVLVM